MVYVVAAVACSPPAHASAVQPGFSESVVFKGLTEPTDIAFAPDGRAFVSEKSGLIKVFANLEATTSSVSADLRTQVYNFWDRGLLSIALDPQFPTRPYLYALYTADAAIGGTPPRWGQPNATSDPCPTPPGATDDGCLVSTRLSKLTLSGNVVTNEQVLINDWCQQYPSHSDGDLVFGPDGKLYASGGDGASFTFVDYGQDGSPRNPCGDPGGNSPAPPSAEGGALRAQDVRTLSDPTGLDGTVIRVDPDTGAGVAGNPLFSSLDVNARRIVATGMRNPFRFTFKPGTSEIFLGDVGWNDWEEINRVARPDDSTIDNFGWPCYEGNGPQPGYQSAGLTLCSQLYSNPGLVTPPIFTYEHGRPVITGEGCATANGSSASGLAFYQGGNFPAAYSGALFFADYSRRCAWVMFEQNGQPDPSTRQVFLQNIDPVNLMIGPGGDLFVVDFTGSIRRVSYAAGNHPPTAVAAAEPRGGPLPLTVNFDATGSTDPDSGTTLSYEWDLDGDGQYDDSTAAKPSRTYTTAATITVRLRVSDGALSSTDSIVIGPGNNPPQAVIDAPTVALHWAVGDKISFSGHGTDPDDGLLGPGSMSWKLVMRHCPNGPDACHSHPLQTFSGASEGEFTAEDHDYPSHLELSLTVADSKGLTDTTVLRLDPRTVDLAFASNPPGLSLAVGSDSDVTPFTRTVIVSSRNTITAPSPQLLGSSWQGFASWSDGGSASHEITAPAAATSYTATYTRLSSLPGLVLGYGFDEPSGTTVTDSSPVKNEGTLIGATRTTSGKYGGALSFNGTSNRVDVPDSASLDLTNAMTLEAWVRPSANGGWRTAILKERGGAGHVYALYASDGIGPTGEAFIGNAYSGAPAGTGLPLNTWSHIASTYDGTTLRLYVNGTQVASKGVEGAMTPTTSPLRIGGNAIWGEYFAGQIDEVRIYNRALSATEIQGDQNAPVSGPCRYHPAERARQPERHRVARKSQPQLERRDRQRRRQRL